MAALSKSAGGDRGLYLEVTRFPAGPESSTPELGIHIRLCGSVVWGKMTAAGVEPVRGNWLELVRHLARVWPYLRWEERYPLQIEPTSPADFLAIARQRLARALGGGQAQLERQVQDFVDAHDLSQGTGGLFLPPLWLVPAGNSYVVASGVLRVEVPRRELEDLLGALGDQILDAAADTPGVQETRAAWAQRDYVPVDDVAAAYVGATQSDLHQMVGARSSLRKFFELRGARFLPSELLAAARASVGTISSAKTRQLISKVRQIGARAPNEVLAACSAAAREALANCANTTAFGQAYAVAGALRLMLGREKGRVDPESILKSFDVKLIEMDLETAHVDALLVWGDRHGPVVIVNRRGKHSQSEAGRRSSLAHEICHLLLDREQGIPLAEAIGGQSSSTQEVRARAFAAELLLPREMAAAEWKGTPKGRLPDLVRSLQRRFGVSAEIVAWQLRNSAVSLGTDEIAYLRGLVSAPNEF